MGAEGRVKTLPAPDVLSCFFDEGFSPRLAAMQLRWNEATLQREPQLWSFPHGISLRGPLPERFGISVERWASINSSKRG